MPPSADMLSKLVYCFPEIALKLRLFSFRSVNPYTFQLPAGGLHHYPSSMADSWAERCRTYIRNKLLILAVIISMVI